MRPVQVGDSGVDVAFIQSKLIQLGYSIALDGEFGPQTEEAIKAFQLAHGIGQTGMVGDQTKDALQAAVNRQSQVSRQSALNAKLYDYYSIEKNYDSVYDDVMGWYGTTSNGCAAFCSTALRHVGLNVPHTNGPGGYNISLVAEALAQWLLAQGWQKITDAHDLLPGDVIVTEDAPEYPGFAAHIWVLGSKGGDYGLAIDNQGFLYNRNIAASGPKTPWKYALRAKA